MFQFQLIFLLFHGMTAFENIWVKNGECHRPFGFNAPCINFNSNKTIISLCLCELCPTGPTPPTSSTITFRSDPHQCPSVPTPPCPSLATSTFPPSQSTTNSCNVATIESSSSKSNLSQIPISTIAPALCPSILQDPLKNILFFTIGLVVGMAIMAIIGWIMKKKKRRRPNIALQMNRHRSHPQSLFPPLLIHPPPPQNSPPPPPLSLHDFSISDVYDVPLPLTPHSHSHEYDTPPISRP